MKIGLSSFSTDRAMAPDSLALEAEKRGFHSLYLPEHTHIPTSRRTPAPTGDAELPEAYRRTLDPYISLAAAAARTSKIRLGTGIGLPAQHDHITFAKQLATLDVLSEGRLVLGIGYGWNHEEMENHGVEVRSRRALVREKMLAMQALWTQEVAEFQGDRIQMEPSWQWPKPVQQPWPTILIGGAAGPKLFAHIAEYADGWMPIGGAGMAAKLESLRESMRKRERDPDSLHIVPTNVIPSEGKLDYYRELGVTEVALQLPSAGRDTVLSKLDEYTRYL